MQVLHIVTHSTLKTIPLFQNLEEAIGNLNAKLKEVQYQEGEIIFSEGETGDGMYIILVGNVEIIKKGKVIGTLKQNDFFGEMAILSDVPRNATVKAKTQVVLLKMTRESFLELMENEPKMAMHISDAVINRS